MFQVNVYVSVYTCVCVYVIFYSATVFHGLCEIKNIFLTTYSDLSKYRVVYSYAYPVYEISYVST